MNEKLKEKIDHLPLSSGCYIYKDIDGNVLYVGKAKKLKTRVNQYFNRTYNNKTANLVKEIYDLEYIMTLSEKEALVLEINLIKQYMPPYNVIFMDDKHYPYIALSKDKYPRLVIKRDVKNKKYIYYGPFPDSGAAFNVINILNQIYPFVKCKHIPKTSCLYYHMGQCLAPCVNKIDEKAYDKYIKEVDSFFKGTNDDLIKDLTAKMYKESENLNFEKAKEYKDLITGINNIQSRQVIEFNDKISRDIIGFYVKENFVAISILMYRNGYLSNKVSDIVDLVLDINEVIISYLMQFYSLHDNPREIYISKDIDVSILQETLGIRIINPQASKGQELLLMAIENAKKHLEMKFVELASKDEDIFKELATLVNKNRISTIEMCDMSHISGNSAVGVVIVNQNGYFIKNKYRKFIINGENKQDDLASTYEVIYRRFYNLLKDNIPFSDMLIVDGGKNQMEVAKKALDTLGIDDVLVCGLAKDDNHHTRAFINQHFEEVPLNKDSKLFMFFVRMQDEVHRFAITFFRNKKAKSMLKSTLDDIKGLGKVRLQRLLTIYQSIDEIAKAPIEQLCQILPRDVAINLHNKLNGENKDDEK